MASKYDGDNRGVSQMGRHLFGPQESVLSFRKPTEIELRPSRNDQCASHRLRWSLARGELVRKPERSVPVRCE